MKEDKKNDADSEEQNEKRREQVVKNLKRDFSFEVKKGYLRNGKCPACHKSEMFTSIEKPWVIHCPRENKCKGGPYRATAKQLYPELYENYNNRCPPTDENPNATADAYMQESRGFDLSKIRGLYTQGKFYTEGANKSTATVRFMIDEDHDIYMERFVETIIVTDEDGDTRERKQHFKGKYKGLVWQPPGQEIKEGDQVFIVEACIDAISLVVNGYKSVATLGVTNYPDLFLSRVPNEVTWVWALDNDKAGIKYIREYSKRMQKDGFNVRAALPLPGEKSDWNDLHKKKRITDAHMKEYFHQGDLLLAKTAKEKALKIWYHSKGKDISFHMDFNNYWYFFSMNPVLLNAAEKDVDADLSEDQQKLAAGEKAATLVQLARCKLTFLYYQRLADSDDGVFYTRVDFP